MTTQLDKRLARVDEELGTISRWERKLRTNCELLRGSRGAIPSIRLMWTLSDDRAEIEKISQLARDLAAEHGLDVSVEPRRNCLTVRFRSGERRAAER